MDSKRAFIFPDRDRLGGLLVGLCCSNLTAVGTIVPPAIRVARATVGKHLAADELDRIQQFRRPSSDLGPGPETAYDNVANNLQGDWRS